MKTRNPVIATALPFSLATTSAYTTTPLEPLLRDRRSPDAFARRRENRVTNRWQNRRQSRFAKTRFTRD